MQRPVGVQVIVSIQYLRAVAALSVAFYHLGNHAGISFEVGAAGVDLFFVISGFIMWTVTIGRKSDPGSFMLDRVTRIAPPYILLTVLVFLIARYVPSVFPNMRTSVSHTVQSMLFIPHTDPYGTSYPVIVAGWTLNYELFFYAVFAIMLFLPARMRLHASTAILILLVVIGLSLGPALPVAKAYTSPLLLEFCAGLWLGAAWTDRRLPAVRWGAGGVLAGGAGLVLWQVLQGTDPGLWRAFVWGIPAVFVVGGALTIERHETLRQFRPLLLLGNASYSIYLINAFTTAAAWRLMHGSSVQVYYIVGMLLAVAGGLLFWWLVERPLTRHLRRWFHRQVPISDLPFQPVPNTR